MHELVRQATAAPGVYVFGELLEAECVRALAEGGGEGVQFLRMLELFAFGTYSDYKSKFVSTRLHLFTLSLSSAGLVSSLPPLSPPQILKLKQLTLVSLAAQSRVGPMHAFFTCICFEVEALVYTPLQPVQNLS